MKNFKKFLTLVLAVMMIVSSVAFSTSAATTKFEDIDAKNETLVKAVDLLSYMGVAKGTSETTFGADELVTRQQFALFIYRLMKGGKDAPANASNSTKFTDLEDATYFYAISWANAEGIVNGKSKTTFGPKDPIKLQEAYAMIVRALDWDEDKELIYPYSHIEIAEQEGVELDAGLDSSVGYADELTRGDMAILLYNAFFAETGVEEVATREREIGSGDNATWVLEEYTTNPRLCEKAFDVVEVEYTAVATPHFYMGDAEPTYDLGYDAVYFEKVADSEVNEDATEAPEAVYLTAEDLGIDAKALDAYFMGEFTMFVTVDDEEIEKVLFADCNMVKKTVTDLKLGEVSTNKAESYFSESEEEAKLLSGKLSAGTEDMYLFNAPYTYAQETYATGATAYEKYLTRNTKNLQRIDLSMETEDDVNLYTVNVYDIVPEVDEDTFEEGLYEDQALAALETFYNVYYDGLYEADLYDVDGDNIYDYIYYKPYTFFQVDADEDEYFDESEFEEGENGVPYIYTNEATVTGEDFANEDYVIGYFSEDLETVHVAAVVKPTVASVANFKTRDGSIILSNGDVIDAVSAWTLFYDEDAEIVWDLDAKKDEIVADSALFNRDILDGDELEFYIYDGKLIAHDEVETNVKFAENLIIPTDIKPVKAGPFDPATGNTSYYVYAYVDGKVKYVPVAVDEDIDNPIVNEDGEVDESYFNTLCTYTENDGFFTIVPLEFDLYADGDVEEEALSQDVADLDDDKKDNQIFAAELGSTITKIAGSRFDIGFERTVDFKSYTKLIIRVYDEEDDEYTYSVYDASSFTKSLKEDVALENMKAIISNNVDSESRENLVLLYAETTSVEFQGKVEKDSYRIVSTHDAGLDDEGEWRNFYALYNPYTGTKENEVPSVEHAKKASSLEAGVAIGTMVKLVDGMVDADEYVENADGDALVLDPTSGENLVWIAEVDEAEGYFVVAPYDNSLTNKDEIEAYVEDNTDDVYDLYGNVIGSNFIDFDKNTVVTVIKRTGPEYMFNDGSIAASSMSAVAKAGKDLLCWNDKALDRNDKYVTKYADYVKAYVSVDTDVDEDENPVAEFVIVVVNGKENAALDAE